MFLFSLSPPLAEPDVFQASASSAGTEAQALSGPSRSGRPAPLWSCVGGLRNGSESLQNLQSIFCNYTFILNLLNFKLDDSFTLIFLYVVISKFFVHLCSHADTPIAF